MVHIHMIIAYNDFFFFVVSSFLFWVCLLINTTLVQANYQLKNAITCNCLLPASHFIQPYHHPMSQTV